VSPSFIARRSRKSGDAASWTYGQINFGNAAKDVQPADYRRILLGVAGRPDGLAVALEMLDFRLHTLKRDKQEIDKETVELGRELLLRCEFEDRAANGATGEPIEREAPLNF
jgi:hypothetical protein